MGQTGRRSCRRRRRDASSVGAKNEAPPGGLEPPTFRLTAERANQLRHGGFLVCDNAETNALQKECDVQHDTDEDNVAQVLIRTVIQHLTAHNATGRKATHYAR